MSLFNYGEYILHSGALSSMKIDCDELSDEDLHSLAAVLAQRYRWSQVLGVPSGGLRFAQCLRNYNLPGHPILIVDDVLTTGASMQEMREELTPGEASFGVVIFARGECPDWVIPMFRANGEIF